MRAARFTISNELLGQVLHLPALAKIVDAHIRWPTAAIELVVEDPELPDSAHPHDVDPTVTRTVESIVWEWNLPGPKDGSLEGSDRNRCKIPERPPTILPISDPE